ncbi:hypothetical protein [Campylobacter concisus]|uniref:hypothetical protein n=1 Tax=Campylobacter concisus TaxID=199 RepID=UPI002234C48D|nr:hypothetical protein [Campylobacter concisus]
MLIFAGVFGFAKVLQKFEFFKQVAIYGGFIFLFVYSLKSLYGALKIPKAFFLVRNTSPNLAK